ncbi:unnamed protein product [Pleuronectes platessa]|uniref:Uncharacterized protein n=1 Tax=Pleuronectes platessa TaxID=8262 RepID=A0A9N7YPZ4_PLEPL|nr:unnamed protein product [Pleuronectes platessa]
MASPRIQRWAVTLAAYEYTIFYKADRDHTNADALSRLPLEVTLWNGEVVRRHIDQVRGRSSPSPKKQEALPEASLVEPPIGPETSFCADEDVTAAETADELTEPFAAEEQSAVRRSQRARKAPDYFSAS